MLIKSNSFDKFKYVYIIILKGSKMLGVEIITTNEAILRIVCVLGIVFCVAILFNQIIKK